MYKQEKLEELRDKLKLYLALRGSNLKEFVERTGVFKEAYCLHCKNHKRGKNLCDINIKTIFNDTPLLWIDETGVIFELTRSECSKLQQRQRCFEWIKYV